MLILGFHVTSEKTEIKNLSSYQSELDKSVVMAWEGSPAESQMNLFLEYPFTRKSVVMSPKNMAEAVTRDMASSDCLKLAPICLFKCI